MRSEYRRWIGLLTLGALTLALITFQPTARADQISFRAATFSANAETTTLVVDRPTGVTTGDVMVASVDVRGTPTITRPVGWTLIRNNVSGTALKKSTYYHIATSAEPASYTWLLSTAKLASGGIVVFSGLDTAHPIDTSSGRANAASSSVSAPSLTTTAENTVIVGFFSTRTSGPMEPPADMTERFDVTANAGPRSITSQAADVAQAVAGPSGDKVATTTGSGVSIGQLVALKPAGSNTPPNALDRGRTTYQDTSVAAILAATDAEQCQLEFSIVTSPANGSLSEIGGRACTTGSPNTDTAVVTYRPSTGFVGSDSFTYRASDATLESNVATVTITVKPTPAPIAPVLETDQAAGSGDVADDPAIWIHPTDRSLSLVIGTNKDVTAGGLHVYDLDGAEVQYLPTGKTNNVDLRYGFTLNGQIVDLVGATNKATNSIDFFIVLASSQTLEMVGSIPTTTPSINGFCMYESAVSGMFYAIANFSNGTVEQYELSESAGTITGSLVRRFDAGGMTEGCVADDELGRLYVSEETQALWRYGAEPGDGDVRDEVDVDGAAGNLEADIEGASIYYGSDGLGYLIVSSQGDSTYAVYTRQGLNSYLGSFKIVNGNGVDSTQGTDGVDVSNVALGGAFPQGLLVLHDHINAGGTASNYKFVRWDDLAAALGLTTDTSHDPRS